MNCKPNDLARVVSTPATDNAKLSDRIVRVVELLAGDNGAPYWTYAGAPIKCGCGCRGEIHCFADRLLRPIGNPGDDAVDETLVHNPAPVREEISA